MIASQKPNVAFLEGVAVLAAKRHSRVGDRKRDFAPTRVAPEPGVKTRLHQWLNLRKQLDALFGLDDSL